MKNLNDHILGTYVSLRYGLAIIGAALPLLVYGIGTLSGIGLQNSLSAYYWAHDGTQAPARDWLVGCLFAVAACLYLYKGFTRKENLALNLAAILGVGVAVLPGPHDCAGKCPFFTLHGFCAVSMFLCLVYVVWFRAGDTLDLLPPDANPARYRQLYKTIGAWMLASPLTAFVMNSVLGKGKAYIFFVEAAGIWAFAAYWLVKSTELNKSGATRKALRGEIAAV